MQKTFKKYKNCQKYKMQKRNNYLVKSRSTLQLSYAGQNPKF